MVQTQIPRHQTQSPGIKAHEAEPHGRRQEDGHVVFHVHEPLGKLPTGDKAICFPVLCIYIYIYIWDSVGVSEKKVFMWVCLKIVLQLFENGFSQTRHSPPAPTRMVCVSVRVCPRANKHMHATHCNPLPGLPRNTALGHTIPLLSAFQRTQPQSWHLWGHDLQPTSYFFWRVVIRDPLFGYPKIDLNPGVVLLGGMNHPWV